MASKELDFSDPATVVRAFIHQMHCWEALAGSLRAAAEARLNPAGGSTLHPTESRLNGLFKQIPPFIVEIFLTKKDAAFVPGCSYSTPPEWDAKLEKVTRVVPKTKSQVIVETDRKSDYYGGLREYILKKEGEVWLIDSVSASLGGKKRKLTLL